MKQIYHCSACRYTFEAEPYTEFPARCPDCGKVQVWPADEAEIEEYVRIQEELLLDTENKKTSHLTPCHTQEEVEAALKEQGCDLNHKVFYDTVREKFGSRGVRQASCFLEQVMESFRNPNFPLVDAGVMLEELKGCFIMSKEIARKKFTPKKYRKESSV